MDSIPYSRAAEPGDYIDSFYSRTLEDDREYPPLCEEISAPVCIVGGGMAGVAALHSLADRGIHATLLEAKRIGFGASGRNGGFVSPGYSADAHSIAATVGKEHARNLYQLVNRSFDLILERIGKRKDELCTGPDGLLGVSWFDQPETTRAEIEFRNEIAGSNIEFWPREKIRDLYLTQRYFDGGFKPDGLQLNSLNYLRHSAASATGHGARIFERSPVVSIAENGTGWRITTATGSVKADQVIVCCSAYINNLEPALSRAMLPVATFIMVTESLGDRLDSAILGRYGVSDNRFSSNYYRVLPDGRLFWGGRVSSFNPTGARLENIMLKDMLKVYPQLEGVRPELAWGGYMGYAVHRMPQVGELHPGFWYAQGFGGSGMTPTVAAGDVVAAAIADGDESYKLFEPFGLRYAGKPFGPAIAQCAYWLFQAQDGYRSLRRNGRLA